MTRIIGISGSLRRDSFNTALLRAAGAMMPDDATLTIRLLHDIPLYNFDVETEGIPSSVAHLKDEIAASSGLLIATPEYNNSIPGVVKNAIDWLSRPPNDIPRVFGDLPVAIMGATPGQFGTVLSQSAWLPVLRTLGTRLWTGGRLVVPGAEKVFDQDGNIVDERLRERLQKFVHGFVAFVRSQ
jgi:NAD(P)H-dependent FMN reductase